MTASEKTKYQILVTSAPDRLVLRSEAGRLIAGRIRAELVCCDAYDRYVDHPGGARRQGHEICYWGEAAARIAEEFNDQLDPRQAPG